MSISHIIILGIFVILGSAGLSMIQSALGVVWKASGFSPQNDSTADQLALRRIARVKIGTNQPL